MTDKPIYEYHLCIQDSQESVMKDYNYKTLLMGYNAKRPENTHSP